MRQKKSSRPDAKPAASAQSASLPSPSAKRLNKAIAETGFCSRRKADELVFAGRISVNGAIERNPAARVSDMDILRVDGRELRQEEEKIYILLNKPLQTVCTLKDPQGRKTVIDLLPSPLKKFRLFPVGRLDYFSEGLLLLTNDGDFAMRLTHPRYHVPKTYEVIIRGSVPEVALEEMSSGMTLPGGVKLRPVKIASTPLPSGNTRLEMTLQQGINRQIRKMCDKAGLVILKLKRIGQGPLDLGSLRPGECRPLTMLEIDALSGQEKKTQ